MRAPAPLLLVCLPFCAVLAAEVPPDAPALTICSAADPLTYDPRLPADGGAGPFAAEAPAIPGFAIVRETRVVELAAGEQRLDLPGVPARIDAASLELVDAEDPAALRVLASAFRFDAAGTTHLLEQAIGSTLSVGDPSDQEPDRRFDAVLLAVDHGTLVLRTRDGVRLWQTTHDIRLAEPAGGLVVQPTLRCQVQAEAAGRRRVRATYRTDGLTWRADYRLVLASDGRSADLGAWATVVNRSGAGWRGARIRLLADAVRPAGTGTPDGWVTFPQLEPDGEPPTEKPPTEYHLYPLARPADLPDRGVAQLALFPAVAGVAVVRRLVYDPVPEEQPLPAEPQTEREFRVRAGSRIDHHVALVNETAAGLGMALPRGRLRLYQADPDGGAPGFLGEHAIDHSPAGQTIELRLGTAAGVTGERRQIDFAQDDGQRTISERFAVTIRNTRDEAVEVAVRERFLRWGTWRISQQSDRFERDDATSGRFLVEVPARGEKQVEYEVTYSY